MSIQTTILTIHTLIALGIIGLVLIQRGKGADAGAAFGAGASGTVFGSRGSGSFFSRATAILATAFFATSLTLAFLSSQGVTSSGSLMENAPAQMEAPAADEIPAAEDLSTGDLPTLDDVAPTIDDTPLQDSGLPELPEEPADEETAPPQ